MHHYIDISIQFNGFDGSQPASSLHVPLGKEPSPPCHSECLIIEISPGTNSEETVAWYTIHYTTLSPMPPPSHTTSIPSRKKERRIIAEGQDGFQCDKTLYHCLWVSGSREQGHSKQTRNTSDKEMDLSLNPNVLHFTTHTLKTRLLRWSRWASVSQPRRQHWAPHSSSLFSSLAEVLPSH